MKTELEAYKILLETCGYGLNLNINDVFAWGCADSEEIESDDGIALIPFIQRYGYTAIIAYVSIKRQGTIPQGPVLKLYPEFYKVRDELQKLADTGDILFSEYFDREEQKKEMMNFGGQRVQWRYNLDRFHNILNKEPKISRCVVYFVSLKDGTLAVGRSQREALTRLKRNYERRKKAKV